MRSYFDGMLPEGRARTGIAKAAKASSRLHVKPLAALGIVPERKYEEARRT